MPTFNESDTLSCTENVLFCAVSHLNALYGAATSLKTCGKIAYSSSTSEQQGRHGVYYSEH